MISSVIATLETCAGTDGEEVVFCAVGIVPSIVVGEDNILHLSECQPGAVVPSVHIGGQMPEVIGGRNPVGAVAIHLEIVQLDGLDPEGGSYRPRIEAPAGGNNGRVVVAAGIVILIAEGVVAAFVQYCSVVDNAGFWFYSSSIGKI